MYFEISIDGQPQGKIVIGLFGETVPKTVKNFITLATTGVKARSYVNTPFHRIIKHFMVQGKSGYCILSEYSILLKQIS